MSTVTPNEEQRYELWMQPTRDSYDPRRGNIKHVPYGPPLVLIGVGTDVPEVGMLYEAWPRKTTRP